MPKFLLTSRTVANYVTMDDDGDKVLEPIGKGILVFSDDDTVSFFKKKFFGGYEDEANHCYARSSVMHVGIARVEGGDGLEAEVYFPATEDEPAEVMTYVYELTEDEATTWEQTLSKPKVEPTTKTPQPVVPPVIREKETIIKEVVVKVRCSHCGNLYDERDNKCPNCGGR